MVDKIEAAFAKSKVDEAKKDKYLKRGIIIAVCVTVLYFSHYVINAAAETVRACKNLKRAYKE
jgi:hypothetical protein